MSIEFKLPELGENIASGDIVKVLVHEGDEVQPNQGVFELETDKAVIEVPCRDGGTVTKVHVTEGQKVKVGQVLLTLEPSGDEKSTEPQSPGSGSGVSSNATAPSRSRLGFDETPSSSATTPPSSPPSPSSAARDDDAIPAGPVARRLARERGVDLTQVAGSGPRGRIMPEDVERAAGGLQGAIASLSSSVPAGKSLDKSPVGPVVSREPVVPPGREDQDAWGPVRRDRMSQIRRTIAKRMSHSAGVIPHVTNFDDADVTDLEAVRKSVPDGWLAPGVKLTMMPLVLKAVATALLRHPALNASLDEEKDEIVYKQYVNLGVAVDTPRGLVVPVLRGVDRMTIPEIAQAVAHLAQQARGATFSIEDLRGGTFTISNLGAVGGTYSTPIINHPEAALLLLGRTRWLPVVRDGQVLPRLMMPLSLSYDHRLVDGATAGRFLNEVIELLQSPGRLLL